MSGGKGRSVSTSTTAAQNATPVSSDLPEVSRVVVGSGPGSYPAPDRRFVEVGPENVEFETGTTVLMQRFRIARRSGLPSRR